MQSGERLRLAVQTLLCDVKNSKRALFIVLIIHATFANAQDKLFPSKGTFNFKFAPANIFNPEFSSLDGAVSYYLTDKYAIEIKFGKKIGLINSAAEETKFDGYKIFAEVQRVVSRKMAVSFEFGFSSNDEAKELKYYNSADEPVLDNYIAVRKRWSAAPKLVIALYRKGNFLAEAFGGVGLKRVHKYVTEFEFDESAGDRDTAFYESLFGGGPGYTTYWKTDVRVSLGITFCFLAKVK